MGSVAIKNGGISVLDLTWVIKNDDLSDEHFSVFSGVILGIRADITSLNVLDRQVLNVETNIVTGSCFFDLFVMHLDRFDFSGSTNGTEGDNHTWLKGTSLNTTDGYCTDTTNLVDIL